MVTLFNTLGDQAITWNYTEVRLFDKYAQLNRPTVSEMHTREIMQELILGIWFFMYEKRIKCTSNDTTHNIAKNAVFEL